MNPESFKYIVLGETVIFAFLAGGFFNLFLKKGGIFNMVMGLFFLVLMGIEAVRTLHNFNF